MKSIKEYRIDKNLITPQTFYVTKGAKVVNLIDLGFDIAIIVVCDPLEIDTELRTFKICDTFERLYEDSISYIGNFGMRHVIEIL